MINNALADVKEENEESWRSIVGTNLLRDIGCAKQGSLVYEQPHWADWLAWLNERQYPIELAITQLLSQALTISLRQMSKQRRGRTNGIAGKPLRDGEICVA